MATVSLTRTLLRSWIPKSRVFSSAAAAADRLISFDTTLRDGEQSPGCTLQLREKVAIAHQLARLGVDVCEAGFPVASPGDFEAVRTIARDVGPVVGEGRTAPMVICGLARATEKDIDRCFDAVRHAPLHRVHTFLATSDIHVRVCVCVAVIAPRREALATVPLPPSPPLSPPLTRPPPHPPPSCNTNCASPAPRRWSAR